MANYDPSLQSGTSEETAAAVSTSLALSSPYESMWEGWTTQTSSAAAHASAPTISVADLQMQGLGAQQMIQKSSTTYRCQTDLLSSWLSSFQSLSQAAAPGVIASASHDQPRTTQDGILVYPDEFSGLNLCSTSSDRRANGVAHSDTSQQLLMDRSNDQSIMRPDRGFCSSQTQVKEDSCNKSEDSGLCRYRRSTGGTSQSSSFDHNCKVARSSEQQQHMVQTAETDLNCSSTSSPTSIQMPPFSHMMQHLVGQYDHTNCNSSSTWLSCVAAASSQVQPSDNQLRPVQQPDPTGTLASSESGINLHHHDHRPDNSFPSDANNPYINCNPSAENMYAELHGLLTITQQDPLPGTSQLQETPARASTSATNSNHAVGWSFTEAASAVPILDSNVRTKAAVMSITNRCEDPSSSSAGKSRSSTSLRPADPERQEKRSSRDHSDEPGSSPAVKRSCIERAIWQLQPNEAALLGRVSADPKFHASFGSGFGTSTSSSGLDIHSSLGPALNTNGKPRARRGSATDPQSVYARHRRERITERLRILQHLVPNGTKVDIVTMLEEAINYVKFLQLQVRLLSSDEYWIYAPTTYNGVDVSMGMHFQGME